MPTAEGASSATAVSKPTGALPVREDVAIVDWLGRGGIAQTTESWSDALAETGEWQPRILTRGGREIRSDGPGGEPVSSLGPFSGVHAHVRLARRIARWIRDHRPPVVVIQNYVLPLLERPVYDAVRATGARLVVVVHDDRPHSGFSGTTVGLQHLLRSADVVVCHSDFVASRIRGRRWGIDPIVVPHPLPVGLLAARRPSSVLPAVDRPTVLHLGILKRQYKGGDLVRDLANAAPDWRFASVGTGASEMPNGVCLAGFRPPGELVQVMTESDVVLLPYRRATQSGVAVLAHATRTIPVVHDVGGLREQVRDHVDGRVLPAGSSVDAWRRVLDELRDPSVRAELAANGRASVEADDRSFRRSIADLVR